jgi:hypothetical protein
MDERGDRDARRAPPPGGDPSDLDPRIRRTLELVYQVEGVVAAKVWLTPENVSIGVRIGAGHGVAEVLARIEQVTVGLREVGESWDFGLLDGDV